MTHLTPAERSAIAAYTGPVTICPPHTFTEGLYWNGGRFAREDEGSAGGRVMTQRAAQATEMVAVLLAEGKTPRQIQDLTGFCEQTVRNHIKKVKA